MVKHRNHHDVHVKVLRNLLLLQEPIGYRNDLIVRGGSPSENRFYLDGVEIPNINHFSTQGDVYKRQAEKSPTHHSQIGVVIKRLCLIGICPVSYTHLFTARQGKWIGAKVGLFCVTPNEGNRGWADVDWFRMDK